jgi:hypothetical protein
VVLDQLTGQGGHSFDLLYHLMPDLHVNLDPSSGKSCVKNSHGASLQIIPVSDYLSSVQLIEGDTDPVQGWVGLYSGEKSPAPALRYHRVADAPTSFCTLFYPQSARSQPKSLGATQLAVTTKPAIADLSGITALAIDTGDCLDYLVIAPGTKGICKRFADYETDAELLYMRQSKVRGDVLKVEMHKGNRLHYQFQPLSVHTNGL